MRILIADDHELMRKGISALFENRADFEVLEASNGAEAVQRVVDDKPDLVILDVSMPIMDGFSAARQIKQIDPHVLVVILTLQKTETFASIAEKIGIDGYLTKNIDGSVLRAAVDSVIEASKKRGGAPLEP
jgi:DNA-binding NarL/FixJ family response regulator